MNENEIRNKEVSEKLTKIGVSLIKEGAEKENYQIVTGGNLIKLIGGLVQDPKSMNEFNELALMFTAKKILDETYKSKFDDMFNIFPNFDDLKIDGFDFLKDLYDDDDDDDVG